MKKAFIGILVLVTMLILFVGTAAAKAPDVSMVTHQEASVSISADVAAPADDADMNVAAIFVVVLATVFLAVLIESSVEFAIAPIFNNIPKLEKFKWLQMYIALGVGILSAFVYQLDLISLLSKYLAQISAIDFQFPVTIIGLILTGAAIGRGSNYLHDLVMKWFAKSTLNQIAAGTLTED